MIAINDDYNDDRQRLFFLHCTLSICCLSSVCVCVSSCLRPSSVRQALHRLSPTYSTCPTDRVLSTRPLPLPPPPPLPRLSVWGSWLAVSVDTAYRNTIQKYGKKISAIVVIWQLALNGLFIHIMKNYTSYIPKVKSVHFRCHFDFCHHFNTKKQMP